MPTDWHKSPSANAPHSLTPDIMSIHNQQNRLVTRNRLLPVILGGLAILSGCAIIPEPTTTQDVRDRVNADQFKIYSDQEPVFKPISFEEALARALKYNLDYRLKLMESAVALGLADVAKFDMLPSLTATAGYSNRSNDAGTSTTGISSERSHTVTGIELSWNILDFGVNYFRAKQQADQVLVAEERKRRVVQNVLQDVRSAYWRAAGAQRLTRDSAQLMERVKLALERSRDAETQGLLPPKDALTYQRLLLDAVQLLTARRQELELAKRELAALMNVTPGTQFSVVETNEPDLMPAPINVAELEEVALVNRAELREEDYRARITSNEVNRQLVALLPGLTLGTGPRHDTDKYLLNNTWIDSSARVTFNMLRLLSVPAINRTHEAQTANDEARRLALTMAVLTQVRVAVERYRLALSELEVARESSLVDQRLASYARAAMSSRADAELEVIRTETRALNSEYQRYAAYASAQAAFGRIFNSIGLDFVPEGLDKASISELGMSIAKNLDQLEDSTFVRLTFAPPKQPSLLVRFLGVNDADLSQPAFSEGNPRLTESLATQGNPSSATVLARQNLEEIRATVEKALARNKIDLAKNGGTDIYTLSYRLLFDASHMGVRRAQWEIALLAPDDRILGVTRYTSSLSSIPTPRSLVAFAEAATIANLRKIDGWLKESRLPATSK